MVRDTINNTLRTWNKDTFTHTTVTNTQSCSLTSTTWRHCLKLLAQNKSHLITKPFQEAEEVYCSCSSILDPSTPSQDWEDGLTTNGSEVWSGIMNISSLSTLDMLSSVTSLTSLVQNSQLSTTFTQDTKPNNSQPCGQMSQKKNKQSIWDTQKSKLNILESKMNTIT